MTTFERPFDAIRRELDGAAASLDGEIRLDVSRERRSGIPEVVLGGRKSTEQVVRALVRLANANGRALATRLNPGQVEEVGLRLPANFTAIKSPQANAVVAVCDDARPPQRTGRIGIITAGSSDAPIAEEAALMAREMGCQVELIQDVGVAGLHRLVQPLERLIVETGVHVVIVVAGMDGALPSVVAGLVPVPVIGVPTSVGYGYGGNGEGALMTMLQSCAPGLVVVNIDNGIGAGSTAALIANQSAN